MKTVKNKNRIGFLLLLCCGALLVGQSYAIDASLSFRIVNVKSGKVLQPENNSNGAAVRQYTFTGASSQLWHGITAGDDDYNFINNQTGLCMSIKGNNSTSGTPIVASTYNGLNDHSQSFILKSISTDGYKYNLWNIAINKYLDISGASTADGAPCIIWTLNGTDGAANQQWTIISTPDTHKVYQIVNLNSYKTLAPYGRAAQGEYIAQYADGWGASTWKFKWAGSGYYYIINTARGLYADINGGSTQQGALNIIWTYTGGDNQKWKLLTSNSMNQENGDFNIQNKRSSLYLDISGASLDDGEQNIQWSLSTGRNQLWH